MVEVINKTNGFEPRNMIIDVTEERARELTENGYEYLYEVDEPEEIEEERPNSEWIEKKIKKWMFDNKIPIKYSITNDEKEDILQKLKDEGFI